MLRDKGLFVEIYRTCNHCKGKFKLKSLHGKAQRFCKKKCRIAYHRLRNKQAEGLLRKIEHRRDLKGLVRAFNADQDKKDRQRLFHEIAKKTLQ